MKGQPHSRFSEIKANTRNNINIFKTDQIFYQVAPMWSEGMISFGEMKVFIADKRGN